MYSVVLNLNKTCRNKVIEDARYYQNTSINFVNLCRKCVKIKEFCIKLLLKLAFSMLYQS